MKEAVSIGKVLMKSFDTWAKGNKEYSKLYGTLPRDVLKIPYAYFHEEKVINHLTYNLWWAKEHNRFIRQEGVKQIHLTILHESVIKFITAYLNKKLGTNTNAKNEKD